MSNEIQKPTAGRIVHFYPAPNDEPARENGAECLPAMVVFYSGDEKEPDLVNLQVFTNSSRGTLYYVNVPHSDKPLSNGPSWHWPEIVSAPKSGTQ